VAVKTEKLRQLDADGRELLRGVQLVCELGIDTEDIFFKECHRELNAFLESESPTPVRQLSETCPAVFVLVLTSIGAQLGNGGELWEPIMREREDGLRLVGIDGANTNKFGEQFRLSLQALGLPTFSHLQRRRNLGPILLHAGIPIQSSEEVWRKIVEFVRNGVFSGREIVQDLRGDSSQIRYFKKPAQSFVLESGAFAVDLIQRMVNVVLSTMEDPEISADVLSSRHGLQPGMVKELVRANAESTNLRYSVPSANIYLDIDSGMGPYCALPPIRENHSDYLWSVAGRTFNTSRFDSRPVQLEPLPTWSVEVMTRGRRIRARKFNSLAPDGGWLFVEVGQQLRLLQNSGDIEEGFYFVLVHRNQSVRVAQGEEVVGATVADSAGLGNKWSNYLLYEIDLEGATHLVIESADGSETKIDVSPMPSRPELVGVVCDSIREVGGNRVFASPPRITFSGRHSELTQFQLSIRTPNGDWAQDSLSALAVIDGELVLDSIVEWITGEYRIDITGPLGSGLSEKFVVMLDGRLEVKDRLFLPEEVVPAVLSYKKRPNSEPTFIKAEFPAFKDRQFLKSTDDSVIVELRIPRIAFDFGGVGFPPDFSQSILKVMATEDLLELREQQLQVRTGRPTELELVMKEQSGEVFHRQPLLTSGPTGYGAIETAALLDSIRIRGAKETLVELQSDFEVKLSILKVQQKLEVQIINTTYQLGGYETAGFLHVGVRIKDNSPDSFVCVQSCERVWEPPQFFPIPPRFADSDISLVSCSGIFPGKYSVGIAVGSSRRLVSSSQRIKVFGNDDDILRYRESLKEDSQKTAEQIVTGTKMSRRMAEVVEVSDVEKVLHFLLYNQRELATESDVFAACVDYLGREGNSRIVAEWLTQVGARLFSIRDIENFVVRLFPIFVDDPLTLLNDLSLELSEEDEVLASRLWTLSQTIGLVFTYRLNLSSVNESITSMGLTRENLDYEQLAELTWPALSKRLAREVETSSIFSPGFGIANFFQLWEWCWPNGRLSDSRLSVLDSLIHRGRELMPAAKNGRQVQINPVILQTAPTSLRPGRKTENLLISMFIHNLYRLAWLSVRPETPFEDALRASQILCEGYGFAKGLSDRALALALLTERHKGNSDD
jgi:hypothetical protein